MADAAGFAPSTVTTQVHAEPTDLYELLRRLEAESPQAPRIGRASRLRDEAVRLGQLPALGFAAGMLASVTRRTRRTEQSVTQVKVHGFGLLGPNGPLPLHFTEYTWQRLKHHADHALAGFLDLFQHRLLSFLYRAWADANPAISYDRPATDRFQVYLGALMGVGTPALRDRDALGDDARRSYAGHFVDPVPNPESLCALLEAHFELPARIEEFVGEWSSIPEHCLWRVQDASLGPAAVGSRLGRLGESTHLGRQVWLTQGRYRVVLGPLTRAQFQRVSPGGQDVAALKALIRGYAGDALRWDLRLILRPDAAPLLQLGAARLGLGAWLMRPGDGTRADLVFEP